MDKHTFKVGDMVDKRVGMLEVQKESDTYPDTCTLSWRYTQ